MRVLRKITLAAVVAAAALTASAVAQPPGGGRGGYGGVGPAALLQSKTVLADLKATDEQKEKLTAWGREYQGKMREARAGMKDLSPEERAEKMTTMTKETYKEIGTVLDEKQVKRLKQVELQFGGLNALTQGETAKTLKVTDEQKDKLKTITEDVGKEMRELGEKYELGRGQPRPADAAKAKEYDAESAKITKEAFEKALALMSDDQKSMYKDMAGEPIDTAKVRAETFAAAMGGAKGKKKKDD